MDKEKIFTTLEEYKEYLDGVADSNPKVAEAYAKLIRDDRYIDSVMADKSLSEREFLEIIALCRQVNYNRSIGGANKAAENETDRLYAKNPWKFVEEFLQNADDCDYDAIPEISISVDERDEKHCFIEFTYNEKGFGRSDIWAITAFSQSTKINDVVNIHDEEGVFYREKTGRKGKGFKAVFSLNAQNVIVHIRSNGFSFKLDKKIGRIMPVWENDPIRMDGKTHVVVELDQPEFSVRDIYPEFRRLFCIDNVEGVFANSPFLFMHRIRMVHVSQISNKGEEQFITEYRENKGKTEYINPISLDKSKAVLAGITKKGIYYREQFQEGEITTILGSGESFSIPLVRYTRMVEDEESYRNYSIISPVITEENTIEWEGGALFRTFPMSMHFIRMPLAIDAPFILNPDRSGVQYSSYKDEEGQNVPASIWNTEVTERLFEKEGILESFFNRIRSIESIRIDRYIFRDSVVVFGDDNNRDKDGNTFIPKIDISVLCHEYPIFKLFSGEGYVSFDDAYIVNKDLFRWPLVNDFFSLAIGGDYRERIVSDIYVGGGLFGAKPIVEVGFADAMNEYLDIVEKEYGIDSDAMYSFVNTQLYPFLKDNRSLIAKKDESAFDKMQIYFSRIKVGKETYVIRESCSSDIKWLHSVNDEAPLSINRYRIFESSPVKISLLKEITSKVLGDEALDGGFSVKKQAAKASDLDTWEQIKDYIEALCYYGYYTKTLKFKHLKAYVLSEKFDPDYNAFRDTKILDEISDEDVAYLSQYFGGDVFSTAADLIHMGVRTGNDLLVGDGNYLEFDEDTKKVLCDDNCPNEVLSEIYNQVRKTDKRINATFDDIKECGDNVILFFLNENNNLFSVESYSDICDQFQKDSRFWNRNDVDAAEILIRACAGAQEELSEKSKRILNISISEVLSRKLEGCIIGMAHDNAISRLDISNDGSFELISEAEIKPRLALLKYDEGKRHSSYYKGNLHGYGSKKLFIRDIKGGNVFLHCDEDGDYSKALEKCVDRRFDAEALRYFDEMEHQYQEVKEQIIIPMLNKTGHNLGRAYEEIEKNFNRYNSKQIISILSYFRSQGYANALGNGNINNEKEIEDDYRDNPWKFIYEFIQNVDDCNFNGRIPELAVSLDNESDRLIFEYNESGFTLDDVKALTKFGDSNKIDALDEESEEDGAFDLEKTGRKGRGFKSVFALPGDGIVVHICSNEFSFKFVKRLGQIVPIWEDIDDAPKVGTRIIIEGFEEGYTNQLMPGIEKMLGIKNKADFFAICPILYLRKLNKISASNGKETFSIAIEVSSRHYSDEQFVMDGDLVAGIRRNGQLVNDMLDELHVTITADNKKDSFDAVRFYKAFMISKKSRICAACAPILRVDMNAEFVRGALYRTLPLNKHILSIPISINAPFDTDSGRSSLADTGKNNGKILKSIEKELIPAFFDVLKIIPNVDIKKYIPSVDEVLFEDYKNIELINLQKVIATIPVLKRFDGEGYISCQTASILPKDCYKWPEPQALCESFGTDKETLVDQMYVGFRLIKNNINLIRNDFVKCLNDYIEVLDVDDEGDFEFFKNGLYPYLNRNFESIRRKYHDDDRDDELKEMNIFAFTMADGSIQIECADTNNTWITEVPDGYYSFGRFRCINSGSLGEGLANFKWLKNLHTTVKYENAFSKKNLSIDKLATWEDAKEFIETVLYFDVKSDVYVPYLYKCVLSDEYDEDKNVFRDGYLATADKNIIEHIIDHDDLVIISEESGKYKNASLKLLADLIQSMGVRKGQDFFMSSGRDIYALNPSTIALLENYCRTYEVASEVLSIIDKAFRKIRKDSRGTLLLSYYDLQNCSPTIFSHIFEYEMGHGEERERLAEDFCEYYEGTDTIDYTEAYLRALGIIGRVVSAKEININLSVILNRCLGDCVRKCKLDNKDDLKLDILLDVPFDEYPSDEIDKALKWLDDENAVSASYEYYTADLSAAFGNSSKDKSCFLFDDRKVILDSANAANSMLRFVQQRYKGKDASFSALISIIAEQNNLKRPWERTKKEYIEELAKFRKDTWKQRELLVPDYDKHLNNATGNSIDFVIPELLQNINDCKFGNGQKTRNLEVDIDVESGTMLLAYDEAGFDYANVYSITAIGQSSKHDESEGEKGLGFKKVFTLFEQVEIFSNGFCFALNSEKDPTIPFWISDKEKCDKYMIEGKTTMLFFATGANRKRLQNIREQWKDLVEGTYVGNHISPLFLKNIDSITLIGEEQNYSREKMEEEFVFKSVNLVKFFKEILVENDEAGVDERIEELRGALKGRKKCELMQPDEQENYVDSISVEVCVPRKITEKNQGRGCLYSTLPTERCINSSVFINVPIELTTGRDGIIAGSDYNKAIFGALFIGEGGAPSIFVKMMELIAKENRELFMLNYLTPHTDLLIEEISKLADTSEGDVKEELDNARLFRSYDTNEMVSLQESYSVDRIVYMYLKDVKECDIEISAWTHEHSSKADDWNLLSLSTADECDKVEAFAEAVGSPEGYFPLVEEACDLTVEFFKDEYGYLEGGEEDE
ncbi:hypothetical protein SAMN04487770_12848 [Butyrivibrio sp. ob235]|uniref:hypothetical protein n=1 Tax=Butyrivibrio sp. ob235 TaxID=1761780 RepID=UPI0008B77A85|nr:hypothetical protein [Butyrivibrio sp. ob235]SEM19689.1 hypothetical protein SAMN04487770_12848 [Butyrivibrio sp. ob235]